VIQPLAIWAVLKKRKIEYPQSSDSVQVKVKVTNDDQIYKTAQ
jgi:hypothetical protein